MASAEEKTLSLELAAALSASVQLHLLPKSTIAVHVLVLHDDGGALPAAICSASLALADASIHLYGLVAAASCALLPISDEAEAAEGGTANAGAASGGGETASERGAAALDCTATELRSAMGTVQVACMPSLDQMTLLRHQGAVPFAQLTKAMQRALAGCRLLHAEMAKVLKESAAAEEDEDDDDDEQEADQADAGGIGLGNGGAPGVLGEEASATTDGGAASRKRTRAA